MRWSLRMGRIAGIDLYLHITFLLLLAYLVVRDMLAGEPLAGTLWTLLILAAVFAVVILHELAHALTARQFSIPTRHITLLPFGGVAQLEHLPREPRQEMLIALAGPAVNLALAFLLLVPLALFTDLSTLFDPVHLRDNLPALLCVINLLLAVFNLLPAFPMDGGRVLRALLALRRDYVAATRRAVIVARVMAVLFGAWGIFIDPLLAVIAVFVWVAAGQEEVRVARQDSGAWRPIADLVERDVYTLTPEHTVLRAADFMLSTDQPVFPVVDSGRLVGLFGARQVIEGMREQIPDLLVSDRMVREFPLVTTADGAGEVLRQMRAACWPALPVLEDERLAGLIRLERLAVFLARGR